MYEGGRRNRKNNKHRDRERREDQQIQPKILLKAKEKDQNVSSNNQSSSQPPQISIATRETTENKSMTQFPNNITIQTKDKENCIATHSATIIQTNQSTVGAITANATGTGSTTIIETVVQPMTRPLTVISFNNNLINSNITKVLQKSNTDFMVIGIVGEQSVGKSTILNLLTCNKSATSNDLKRNIIDEKSGVFRVNINPNKGPSLPRTESLHMYITEDHSLILLDLPPVLCNPNKKDGTVNEIEDIKNIILLFTVCHLVIVVQEDYMNLNLIRLLQIAELSKPVSDINTKTSFINDYFPNILFVKNKAKRIDFLPANIEKITNTLKYFFKDSNLRIHFGQTEKQKRKSNSDTVNYFVFPEVGENDVEGCSYHPPLNILIEEFQRQVQMTPRNQIFAGNGEMNEAIWFELLTVTALGKNDFFLTTYEDTRRCHTHTNNDQMKNNMNFNDD